MRQILVTTGLCSILFCTGCNTFLGNIFRSNGGGGTGPAVTKKTPPPTAEQLVSYMNKNSAYLQTVACDEMTVSATRDNGLGLLRMSFNARMMAQQPKNFRLQGKAPAANSTALDLGSNSDEFWFWVKEIGPAKEPSPLFHCSYEDMEQGKVRNMPLPFQPSWIMETLCMANFGPATRYQLKVSDTDLRLIEQTRSPQGKPLNKVIVFNRYPVRPPNPQIKEFRLEDGASGKLICSARVKETQVVLPTSMANTNEKNPTGGLLPKTLEIRWPEENIKLTLLLNRPQVGLPLPAGHPAFVRRPIPGVRSFDLARGFDATPTSIQRVQGFGLNNR